MEFTFTATQAKVTPGTVKFDQPERADGGRPLSIYLPKADWSAIGSPTEITVTVQATAVTLATV